MPFPIAPMNDMIADFLALCNLLSYLNRLTISIEYRLLKKNMMKRINPCCVFLFFIFILFRAEQTLASQSFGYGENRYLESLSTSPVDTVQELRYGNFIHSVKCMKRTEQSYALYIPSQYLPEKRWPIVYIFDPGARGSIPIELMKEAAERYGYIIAASNNARNGPWEPEAKAAQAMWEDTHARLAIDDSSIYFAGFSGGARVAAYLAQGCKCAEGVLLNSAGFSTESSPSSKDRFAVFSLVGFTDMNYDEIVKVDKTLDTLGILHFLRRFNGSHQWGPKEVWQEAFAWMQLVAMKNGRQPRNVQFIAVEMGLALQRAQAFEDSGNVYFAWQNYRQVSDLFQGLADTKNIDDRAAILEKNVAVMEGREIEEKEIDEQIKIQNRVLNIIELMHKSKPDWLTEEQLNHYVEGGLSFGDLRTQARDVIRRLQKDLESEDRMERRWVLERARGVIFSYLMETAQIDMDSNKLLIAKNFFELATDAQPNIYWPHLSLACCLIRMGDKEESFHELGRARELGLSAQALADMPKQVPEMKSLIDDPEFQKLITITQSEH
jgi:hypothetical protein